MNLMGTGMWSMGFTIANARMKKLLKRLVATPMRKTDYLLAQFLSRLIWLLIEVTVLVVFGWLVFGVRVQRLDRCCSPSSASSAASASPASAC